jgi:mRNA interferase MazF
MEIKHGDIVIVALAGDYGKPRPALIVQAAPFAKLPSITVMALTSECHDEPLLGISLQPAPTNGLRVPSQIMVDKVSTVAKSRLRADPVQIDYLNG